MIACKFCGGELDEADGWHTAIAGDQGGYDQTFCELTQLRALRDRLVDWARDNAERIYMRHPAPDADLIIFDQIIAKAEELAK